MNPYQNTPTAKLIADRARGLAVLYAGSMLGGAGGFGLLAETYSPMVGASGALFGLAINLALWWALDGQLAWETRLGGFASGWVLALLIDPRSRAVPQDA